MNSLLNAVAGKFFIPNRAIPFIYFIGCGILIYFIARYFYKRKNYYAMTAIITSGSLTTIGFTYILMLAYL